MAKVEMNLVGPWTMMVGIPSATADINDLEDAKAYVLANFEPAYEERMRSMGVSKMYTMWETSNLMLNGKAIPPGAKVVFKDGDRLDLYPRVSGGC